MLSEDYDKVVCKEKGGKKNHVHLLVLTYLHIYSYHYTNKQKAKQIYSFVLLRSIKKPKKNCRMNDHTSKTKWPNYLLY